VCLLNSVILTRCCFRSLQAADDDDENCYIIESVNEEKAGEGGNHPATSGRVID